MKIFHCDHCSHLVFFENTACLHCDHLLAYLPDLTVVGSLDPDEGELWRSPLERATQLYRLCENYTKHNVCNWAVPVSDNHPLCESCRLTRVIPDLNDPANKQAWFKLEAAKRRLVYSLLQLRCPLKNKLEDPERGLAFEFLADGGPGAVMTGHANGVITLNIAEADDVERERRRKELGEPYRTILGHFRHEVGHYYWERLIDGTARVDTFREYFGDERRDYSEALQQYYREGPAPAWQEQSVSAYCTAHPWEDWAETWAHYLHMADTLETAAVCGLSLRPRRSDEPALKRLFVVGSREAGSFDQLIESWLPLTYVLNNLNRGLGLPDAYPFVLSTRAIEKLRFVHETIVNAGE